MQGTPVWRRRVADQSITVVCIPVPTLLYQLYLMLVVSNISVQTIPIFTALVVIAPLFGLHSTSNCSWLYIQDPNEVSAGQKWLVLGNSSALALPIISRVRTGYIASLSPMQDRSKEKKLSAHKFDDQASCSLLAERGGWCSTGCPKKCTNRTKSSPKLSARGLKGLTLVQALGGQEIGLF